MLEVESMFELVQQQQQCHRSQNESCGYLDDDVVFTANLPKSFVMPFVFF